MNIAIVGYGAQGKSALEHLNTANNHITVCDVNTELSLPPGVTAHIGISYMDGLEHFDLIVRSPSIHPKELSGIPANKITTNTNLFFKDSPSKNIIGITGTKGKGTTSTLLAKMLQAMGKRVHLGGNIGTPPLELLKQDIKSEDWVVLELANFQLIDLKYAPKIAVCLMVEPEHLDWHNDMAEYMSAKSQMFKNQDESGTAVFHAGNKYSKDIASNSPGKLIGYLSQDGAHVKETYIEIDGQEIIKLDDLQLPGKHNHENICAAVTTAWQVEKNPKALKQVLSTFGSLPFRIEKRKTVNGITYYNDSFASAPGATVAAIEAIPGKKVLILGGYERGLDLSELIGAIKKHSGEITKVILIGASADRIAENFKDRGLKNYIKCHCKTMEEMVGEAASLAEKGGSVVLSPGFPSFDMFKNFEDRGIQFNEAVEKL